MAIDQLAGAFVDACFDARPVEASLLGVRDREDRPADHTYTEAAGPAHSARLVADTGLHSRRIRAAAATVVQAWAGRRS